MIESPPFSWNSSGHDTVIAVPASIGNNVTVVRCFQAGSSPVHVAFSEDILLHVKLRSRKHLKETVI